MYTTTPPTFPSGDVCGRGPASGTHTRKGIRRAAPNSEPWLPSCAHWGQLFLLPDDQALWKQNLTTDQGDNPEIISTSPKCSIKLLELFFV